MEHKDSIFRIALGVGCAYEIVALCIPELPTITHLTQTALRHRWGRYAAWAAAGAAIDHFWRDLHSLVN